MQQIDDFSDTRHKAWCIHCQETLALIRSNRDHVPTQSLLRLDLLSQIDLDNLPFVHVCKRCNEGFSRSEQYLVAFLSAVLSGSPEPNDQVNPKASNILRGDKSLRRDLRRAMTNFTTYSGEIRSLWKPDAARMLPALTKNARGHIYYEFGEPKFGEPSVVSFQPLAGMTSSEIDSFETHLGDNVWPEVGSRMMTRLVEGQDMENGWIVVQPEWYRYSVFQRNGLVCRAVIAEYLAVEIGWED